ncbi:hypothetical protein ACFW04_002647 [Cataglyphis niger]
MASNEDGDLIDLGNDACVPRVPVDDATAEEQEHLLDVCPPKLEQKLFLTRQQEQVLDSTDKGDILVTLGHDKVVPIRKRIDVVSSDTIKRIRDITKNLEPVIHRTCSGINEETQQDTVDHGATLDYKKTKGSIAKHEDETYEAREINNAFDFLAEHDDNEDRAETSSGRLKNENISANRSLSSIRLLTEGTVNYPSESSSRTSSEETTSGSDMKKKIDVMQNEYDVQLDNPAFEYSPNSRKSHEDDPAENKFVSIDLEPHTRIVLKRRGQEDITFERESKKRFFRDPHRKSWTEGTRLNAAFTDELPGIDRSTSLEEYRCAPSVSNIDRGLSSFLMRQPPEAESATSVEDGCSEGSEVDWSWLEEVECLRAAEPLATGGERDGEQGGDAFSPTDESAGRRRACDRRETAATRSAAMSVTATAKSLAVGGSRWPSSGGTLLFDCQNNNSNNVDRHSDSQHRRHRNVNTNNNDEDDEEDDEAARCNATNEAVDRENRYGATTTTTTTTIPVAGSIAAVANSWMRASMRRLRHLRLPEGTQRGAGEPANRRAASVSAPNSLPDIALIAPEILAAQTNGGTSGTLRPSSAPARNAATAAAAAAAAAVGVATPRRTGRQFAGGGRSRGARNREAASSRQGSLGSTTTTSDITASGNTTCSSGASTSPASSTATTPQRTTSRRDSFITKQDKYRWAEPFLLYRDDNRPTHNATTSYKLYETVPDYFSGAVLQRHHLNETDPGVVTLKFQVAFNLAVVWMIVFVSLSKGLRSYGKVVYVFTLVPVFGTLVLCTKLLGLISPGSMNQVFPATVWNEFFINGKSWVAASNEVFLTWGLLGAAAMQIAAHNKHKHLLQRDTSLVVILTFAVLLLGAFLANTCVQILRLHGYIYTTSSFERISGYTFMRLANKPAPSGHSSTPERFMSHASFLLGQRVIRPGVDTSIESGYQVLRLATELVPATLALLGTEQVSPFWAVLFYFILILFGIAQQLAIWHCVITGIMAINTKMMKLWETTITFFSCACAYILGLPMATELGIYVVYYLDYTVGGAWWIIVLYLMQVGAVFAVRGRPHTGEAVVAELFPPTGRCLRYWAGPLLSFIWNVVLPVTLMVLSITIFKSSGFRELYSYRRTSRDYWAVWARQLGTAIQLIPILMIPAVAIIQTCRYLNNGPPDIFDNEQVEITVNHCEQCNGRIQLLYRPPLEPEDPRDAQTQIGNDTGTGSLHGNGILPAATTEIPFEDPPPKYTPPPSYTTATGARIAKMLRQSFRRSVRRIANVLGESSAPRQRPALQQPPPPPDYATVLVEMNQSGSMPISYDQVAIHVPLESRPDVTNIGRSGRQQDVDGRAPDERRHVRPNTIDRASRIGISIERSRALERTHSSTLDRGRRSNNAANIATLSGSNLTATDVANLLRSSIRRGTARTQQSLRRSFCHEEPTMAASVENLVEAAAPIGQDSLILSKDASLVSGEQINEHCRHNDNGDSSDGNDEKKTASEMESSVSVI